MIFCAAEKLLCAQKGSVPSYPTYQFLHPQQLISCALKTQKRSQATFASFYCRQVASHTNIVSDLEQNFLEQQLPKSNFRSKLPRFTLRKSFSDHFRAHLAAPTEWVSSQSNKSCLCKSISPQLRACMITCTNLLPRAYMHVSLRLTCTWPFST